MLSVKEMVSGGKFVHFQFYRENELWYKTETGFEFPVPISDTGTGVFLAEDKAILFMRYIRKHIARIEEGKQEALKFVPDDQLPKWITECAYFIPEKK